VGGLNFESEKLDTTKNVITVGLSLEISY